MFSRRSFFGSAAGASVAITSATSADALCSVFSPDRQKVTTPDVALQLLKEGNARLLAGKTINCDLLAQIRATSRGQSPFAAVVGCIDSRVPPELIFDQRIGDVFVARVAGNFVNEDIIASLEYATKIAGAKAIVVLGHSGCGAIKASIDGAKLGHVTKMLENFKPAIEASQSIGGERSSRNKKLVEAVATANALLAVKQLSDKSEVLRDLVTHRKLLLTAAMQDVDTGVVMFL